LASLPRSDEKPFTGKIQTAVPQYKATEIVARQVRTDPAQ
jgi:hypothetical protein